MVEWLQYTLKAAGVQQVPVSLQQEQQDHVEAHSQDKQNLRHNPSQSRYSVHYRIGFLMAQPYIEVSSEQDAVVRQSTFQCVKNCACIQAAGTLVPRWKM